jgi:3-hydroxy-9,10-secoandrosta-1,3,5(10)-triene-9,17-dione monooxygenase reductase component
MEKRMAPDTSEFRQIMGRFATGVTVVTMMSGDGPYGITVNSFTSVSLNPMLVLVCVDKQATGYDHFQLGESFAVNILSEEQEYLSRAFSSKDAKERFNGIGYRTTDNKAPILNGVIASLECRITQVCDGGDHTIFLGEVFSAQHYNDKKPLLFYHGQYGRLTQ